MLTLLAFGSACRHRNRSLYAVIPKTQGSVFWQAVHAGAASAAKESGVDIHWMGPAAESDFARQIAITDDSIARRVDGILLAPSDQDALVPVIHRARQAGIPISIMDSGAHTDDYVSFVATDNYGGGVLAARRLAEVLHGRGKVAMIALMPGSASTLAREQGFRETLEREFPAVRLVAWQYGMSDRARSLAVSEDILAAHPDLDGMFGSAEPSSIGAIQALKGRGLAGKVKVIGFDTSPTLAEDLRAGVIDALVLQDPFQIGYQGLKTLFDQRVGRPAAKRIDLPPTLVTHDNLEDPKTLRLLKPEIERYLK